MRRLGTIKWLGDALVWLVGVCVALGALYGWIAKPIKTIMGNTDALMGDRLAQAHDHWVHKGYCPPDDKVRLVDIHQRYAKRGLNHLAASFEEDLLRLPDEPARKGGNAP